MAVGLRRRKSLRKRKRRSKSRNKRNQYNGASSVTSELSSTTTQAGQSSSNEINYIEGTKAGADDAVLVSSGALAPLWEIQRTLVLLKTLQGGQSGQSKYAKSNEAVSIAKEATRLVIIRFS